MYIQFNGKMKNITKFIVASILFLAVLPTTTYAQRGADEEAFKNSSPEERAQIQTDFMKKEMGLDEVQTKLVGDLNLKYAKKMEPIIKGDGNKLSKFSEAKSIMSDKDEELKSIVTEEQYKKYDASKDRLKEEMKKKLQEKKK